MNQNIRQHFTDWAVSKSLSGFLFRRQQQDGSVVENEARPYLDYASLDIGHKWDGFKAGFEKAAEKYRAHYWSDLSIAFIGGAAVCALLLGAFK